MTTNDLHTSPPRRPSFFPARNPFRFRRPRSTRTVDSRRTINSTENAETHKSEEVLDSPETWIPVKLPREILVLYLEREIVEWFRDRDLGDPGPKEPPKPWYCGYYKGVRFDKVIRHYYVRMRENWRSNPYGIGALLYLSMLVSYCLFVVGNVLAGVLEGRKQREEQAGNGGLPILKGVLAAMPVTWMLPIFLFPPLIANVNQQFEAHGYYNIDWSATVNDKVKRK
ncbi:hypothetical protein FB567DRAFT_596394 [Paraphoma chrysanthemicola]|uniref:Uncharacterized protein n=1 Tax=Paraphoma chrysanthemicola TaxID=798071 RepID=A0A8K0VU29_9PLEO|nr:hypothetical protein FB567DRAFT_596394 [Paraphoma chrysanthemicola]